MASFLASQSLQQHISIGLRRSFSLLIPYSLFLFFLTACGPSRYISKKGIRLLSDSNLRNAHVGISIFDISGNKNIYSHQSDKYFIPASNTKIFTCYAAMKYLGDSLVALRYTVQDSLTIFTGSGDPTLLHPDFDSRQVLQFLRNNKNIGYLPAPFNTGRWGFGWTFGDINASYMPERSELPAYGNVVRISLKGDSLTARPKYFRNKLALPGTNRRFEFERGFNNNEFSTSVARNNFNVQELPFYTGRFETALSLLSDTLAKPIATATAKPGTAWHALKSHPVDSMLKPMMHRSDNFFAEQTLLIVADKLLHELNESKAIERLLATDLKDLPQKPRWVDGSGLSRYNLFSPDDLVAVLGKINNEFDWNRIITIFPSGGEGTLGSYYLQLKDRIFAKTGTLSNNIALSGFLITKNNKKLIFSVLVNNHIGNTKQIRKAVEKLLMSVAERY